MPGVVVRTPLLQASREPAWRAARRAGSCSSGSVAAGWGWGPWDAAEGRRTFLMRAPCGSCRFAERSEAPQPWETRTAILASQVGTLGHAGAKDEAEATC